MLSGNIWTGFIICLMFENNRREKFGEAKGVNVDFELLLPDKSINDPIDKLNFSEVTSYLSKDQYDYL